MASGSVVPYRRHYKTTQRQKFGKGEDIISSLPDFIISHILSFLPAKDAVSTCVLSKRWEYLWTLITHLLFQDRERQTTRHGWEHLCRHPPKKIRKAHFLNFVNRVLLHLNNSSIQSFSLVISEKYDPSHINDWISAVLRRRVKNLCIDSSETIALPSYSLTKFQSLDKLVLKMDSYDIKVASSVCLPSLTVLELSGITFTRDASNKSKNLNLKFPTLQTFVAKNCSWSDFKIVTVEVPLLEVLSIENEDDCMVDECEIKFRASCLKEFTYIGSLFPASISLDVSAVVNFVYVEIHTSDSKEEEMQQSGVEVCEFLKQFNRKVKCLKFTRYTTVFKWPLDSLPDLPVFEMLNHLELGCVAGENFLCLLRKTPLLNTLIFSRLLEFDKELLNSATVPDCFRTNLQVVEINGFYGSEYELSYAKFLIENAEILKRITFVPSWSLYLYFSNFEDVIEKLYSFKKASNCAIIETDLRW